MNIGDIISRLWNDVTAHVVAGRSTALWPLAVVLLVLAVPQLWHISRHVITIVHEAGHAAVGALLGRDVKGIRLHADTSGLTTSSGSAKRLPLAMVSFSGYTAPAVLGLGGAALLRAGHPYALLWTMVVVLVVVLFFIRNFYGFLVMVVSISAFGWLAWAAPDAWRIGVAYGAAWLLLLGAVRAVVELHGSRGAAGGGGSDADALARVTRVPGMVWVALFWLVTASCAVGGAWLMLGRVIWK